jgi:hypothetical protein
LIYIYPRFSEIHQPSYRLYAFSHFHEAHDQDLTELLLHKGIVLAYLVAAYPVVAYPVAAYPVAAYPPQLPILSVFAFLS